MTKTLLNFNHEYYVDFEMDREYAYELLDTIDEKEDILVIAELGLWNGKKIGYKELSNDARDIIDRIEYSELGQIGTIENNKLIATNPHHDGTNFYSFRVWKSGISDNQKSKLLDSLYENNLDANLIKKYTKPLRILKKYW